MIAVLLAALLDPVNIVLGVAAGLAANDDPIRAWWLWLVGFGLASVAYTVLALNQQHGLYAVAYVMMGAFIALWTVIAFVTRRRIKEEADRG